MKKGIAFLLVFSVVSMAGIEVNVEAYPKARVVSGTGTWRADTAGIKVREIRIKTGGKLRMLPVNNGSSYVNIYTSDDDILRVEISAINMDSTTADTITVFGY